MSFLAMLPTIIAAVKGLTDFGMSFADRHYNKQIQQETWAREDNSYQRMVSDMKLAGLSPAFQGVSGSPSSPGQQLHSGTGSAIRDIESMARAQLLNAQAKGQRMKNYITQETMDNTIAMVEYDFTQGQLDMAYSEIRNQYARMDLNYEKISRQLDNAIKKYQLDNLFPAQFNNEQIKLAMAKLLYQYAQSDAEWKAQAGMPTDTQMTGTNALILGLVNNLSRLLTEGVNFSDKVPGGQFK